MKTTQLLNYARGEWTPGDAASLTGRAHGRGSWRDALLAAGFSTLSYRQTSPLGVLEPNVEQLLRVAAGLLEVEPEGVEFGPEGVRERDGERTIGFAELLAACASVDVPWHVLATHQAPKGVPWQADENWRGRVFPDFTYGCHAVEVEVDLASRATCDQQGGDGVGGDSTLEQVEALNAEERTPGRGRTREGTRLERGLVTRRVDDEGRPRHVVAQLGDGEVTT